jgi:hypothetical protein
MMMNIAGFTLVNWINYGLSFLGGSVAWRFPLAIQFVFIFILYATVPWLPESPRSVRLLILKGISNRTQTLTGYRWLMAHGREAEALEVICCLEAKPADDAYVTTLHDEIAYSISYERQNAVRWRDIFLRRKHPNDTKTIRRLLLGAGTQFMQQFEGINIMSYYLPTVLINYVGLSNEMARLLTACNATSYLIISCLFVPLIERWGRRSLMLFSTFGQFLAFLIITILLRFAEGSHGGSTVATASIAFFFLYYISFGAGMLGIPWLYPTEISSLPMRTKGAAVATATNWYELSTAFGHVSTSAYTITGSPTSSLLRSPPLASRALAGNSGLSGPCSTPYLCP